MKKYTKKFIEYKNATTVKLENKRVSVISKPDYGFQLQFISSSEIGDINEPRSRHKILKNKFIETSLDLSDEALISLKLCIDRELSKRDLNFFEKHSDIITKCK